MQPLFPNNFQWGVATSSFQIEGAARVDGKGESIWDRFCRVPGAIADGSHADVACDHYHRIEEDVALMKDIGVSAYRFSIAWSRILPEGRGRIEERGLAFYDRLVDRLLAAGITPFVTLNHWDLPQALEAVGGWADRERIADFVAYAHIVTRKLGDRIKHWATHNEPWCIAVLGHWHGQHAPGLRNPQVALMVAHHLMVAHGRAVPVIRANSAGAKVGIVLNLTVATPATDHAQDQDLARHHDGHFNRWFLDPLHGRGYPADMVADYQNRGYLPNGAIPFVREGDMSAITEPCDYLGVNYYTREICGDTSRENCDSGSIIVRMPPDRITEMGWEEYPDGLLEVLVRLKEEYHARSLYVMENGCSYSDGPGDDGRIRDARRIRYLDEHIATLAKAISQGVPLRGYFVWSLMDNFEWQFGFQQRFGLIWIDYQTGRRTLKDSAYWYRDKIAGFAGMRLS